MKKEILSSTEASRGRYLVQWFKYENGNEDDDTEYYSQYAPSVSKAIRLLDQVSDSPEFGGIYWAGGLVDDMLTNETIYEITDGYDVYDNRSVE